MFRRFAEVCVGTLVRDDDELPVQIFMPAYAFQIS